MKQHTLYQILTTFCLLCNFHGFSFELATHMYEKKNNTNKHVKTQTEV